MTADQWSQRFAQVHAECDRHARMLERALADWETLAPDSMEAVEADLALTRLGDQIVFRFIKLQDTMGNRLIPATLGRLSEPFEDWPMRDRLDRLEKLGVMSASAWLGWRETRNRLAHEYPDDAALRWAALQQTIRAAGELVAAFRAWPPFDPPH